jgi:hypothetical protein
MEKDNVNSSVEALLLTVSNASLRMSGGEPPISGWQGLGDQFQPWT